MSAPTLPMTVVASIPIGGSFRYIAFDASGSQANSAIFDVRNNFAGCIAGIHEVLRRQGLMRGIWCLDPNESLSGGQKEEIG